MTQSTLMKLKNMPKMRVRIKIENMLKLKWNCKHVVARIDQPMGNYQPEELLLLATVFGAFQFGVITVAFCTCLL